ncbi:helix-hairpin-helix domain-containing protein [Chromatium okenii]|uniref:helix-hairpin-helix domain-containing protein n=1 Tax=Chromatium okenii TaxID=61644 RepID=UPI001F5B6246|nr:helix-hairpin-helix domain-containing protein [Chromatium okenii]
MQFREANGAFRNRKKLLAVPRFGDKAFQLSAGFLRVPDSDEPLDASAVHPERIRWCGGSSRTAANRFRR